MLRHVIPQKTKTPWFYFFSPEPDTDAFGVDVNISIPCSSSESEKSASSIQFCNHCLTSGLLGPNFSLNSVMTVCRNFIKADFSNRAGLSGS